jgi:Cu(I)/Ag(I) efflux system membrane fusion protein
VDYIYPTANPRTRTIPVRLRLDNPDHMLKPAMFANVEIQADPIPDAMTVPTSAVIRHSSQDRVIIALGEGRFRPAAVTPGLESGGRIQILEGISEDERVVTSAQFLIDSEASLDPALLRLTSDMDGAPIAADMKMDMEMDSPDTYETEATVLSLNASARQITLDHNPVPALGWPSMTMGFAVASDVDLSNFKAGDRVRVSFRKNETGYQIISLQPASEMMPEEMAE